MCTAFKKCLTQEEASISQGGYLPLGAGRWWMY